MTITNQQIQEESLNLLERKLTTYSTRKPMLAEISDIICESDKCLLAVYNLLFANSKQLEDVQQDLQNEFIKILGLEDEARDKLFRQVNDDLVEARRTVGVD